MTFGRSVPGVPMLPHLRNRAVTTWGVRRWRAWAGTAVRGLAVVLLVGVGMDAHAAANDCPHLPPEPPPASQLPLIAAELAAVWENCLRDGPYLAYFGTVRLAEGKADEAAALLERAMLVAPWLASARLDYAEALALLGDRAAAKAWLEDVLRNDAPPPLVEARIRAQLAQLSEARWLSSMRIGLRGGYDSNPLLTSRISSLTLTLPTGWVSLPVSTGSSDKGSAIMQAEAQLATRRLPTDADGGTLSLMADTRWRYPFGLSEARYSEFSAGAVWEQPFGRPVPQTEGNARWTGLAGLSGSTVTLAGESLFHSARLVGGVMIPWACLPRTVGEVEKRIYPASRALDGLYSGVAASAVCNVGDGGAINMGFRIGNDRPDSFRAGGTQARSEVRLGGVTNLWGGRVEGDVSFTRLDDRDSYSPILAEGAKRRIDRVLWRAEYAYPLQPGWEAVASIERVQQRSNLELFSLTGTAILFGVRTSLGW